MQIAAGVALEILKEGRDIARQGIAHGTDDQNRQTHSAAACAQRAVAKRDVRGSMGVHYAAGMKLRERQVEGARADLAHLKENNGRAKRSGRRSSHTRSLAWIRDYRRNAFTLSV